MQLLRVSLARFHTPLSLPLLSVSDTAVPRRVAAIWRDRNGGPPEARVGRRGGALWWVQHVTRILIVW